MSGSGSDDGQKASAGADPHGDEPLLTAGAPAAAAEVAVVLLHGRGATAQGIINLFDPVYRHGVALLAPAAERSRWFPEAFDAPRSVNEPHLTSAVGRVRDAVETAAAAGIPPERVIVVGFSQGACVAAEFAARHPREYGGVFVLAGALPRNSAEERRVDGSLSGTLTFLGSSDDDPHVSVDRVRETAATFEAADADVTVDVAVGEGHAVTEASFDALSSRLSALLDAD
ncbi:alpha/beta hydrolase [Haloparvum sedimenti]|uniref:alpha/beta hydrolase n=1 Tax=Haloparvum sedimenti TaxID=1678448 RepID=UPI00071E879C|nr:dienelactone hydrolase family protein [Haloparvum sedimenti]